MSEVKTYCPTWRASVGSTMIDYTNRDSTPDLYVDYHDYKALEAELVQLRRECDKLMDLRTAVWSWWRTKRPSVYTPQMHRDFPCVNAVNDAERLMIDKLIAALTQQEGGEA